MNIRNKLTIGSSFRLQNKLDDILITMNKK